MPPCPGSRTTFTAELDLKRLVCCTSADAVAIASLIVFPAACVDVPSGFITTASYTSLPVFSLSELLLSESSAYASAFKSITTVSIPNCALIPIASKSTESPSVSRDLTV